jgi:hypothetical protein
MTARHSPCSLSDQGNRASGFTPRNGTRPREQQRAEVAFGTFLATASATAKSVANTGWWRSIVQTIDALQRAVRGPSPKKSAIDREVLRTKQRLDLRRRQQQFQELGHELLVEQPITVLGECGGMPNGVVRIEANEPAEQQVLVELLDQHPL